MSISAILIGNPNTGKTTLFNALTKSDEHVGNWHGVTVEEKTKSYFYKGNSINLVDLPGLYSLTTLSYEEEVARDYFLDKKNTKIVNICDESNIRRNLYLTLSLLEYNADVVLAINQIDKKPKYKIDIKKLSQILSIDVIKINANKKEGIENLNEKILKRSKTRVPDYVKKIDLSFIKQLICPYFEKERLDFYAIKCLERDEKILSLIPKKLQTEILNKIPKNSIELVAKVRYDFIDEVILKTTKNMPKVYGKSRADKIVMNKFLSLPIFFLVLGFVFYITFFSVGKWISDGLLFLIENFVNKPLVEFLSSNFGQTSFITSLFESGILGGIGTVLSFLPQVAILFMFLSILEDSGYLARVAFCFEDIFSKLGLSGKSMYTLLMGFGCSSTAILTSRTMEDKNAKIKTAMITPYLSCSAKFPIYAVIGGAFFGVKNIFVIMGLYLLGFILSISLSFIFEKTILKSKEQSFILEFPPYRVISIRRLLKILLKNVKDFLVRIGSVLIAMNIFIWFLSRFTFSFRFVYNGEGSILEALGKILSPIFIPLGFGSWGITSSLLAGIIAKEVIVSSILMFNGKIGSNTYDSLRDKNSAVYFSSNASVLSFLVFSLLYCPCVSSMVVLRKEIGRKWTIFAVFLQFFVAYIVTFFVFNLFKIFETFSVLRVLIFAFSILIIVLSISFVIFKVKKKKLCMHDCSSCHINNKNK